jgi:hypothetical protein
MAKKKHKKQFIIRIKSTKKIDLIKLDKAIKALGEDYELEGFELYRPIKF